MTTETQLTVCPMEHCKFESFSAVSGMQSSTCQTVYLLIYIINTDIYVANDSNIRQNVWNLGVWYWTLKVFIKAAQIIWIVSWVLVFIPYVHSH